MANNKKSPKWDDVPIVSQFLYLLVAFAFIHQQKYLEAAGLLFFPGGIIGLGKTKNLIVKFLNRMILSLAVVMSLYWLCLEIYSNI